MNIRKVFITESILALVGKVVDKLKIKELITVLLIVGVLILFSPDKFLNIFGLLVWRNTYRSCIGGVVLVCTVLCFVWIIIWVRNKIFFSEFAYLRTSRNYLKKIISNEEKEFLIKNFYNFDHGEFASTAKLDITSGNVLLLQNAYIIAPAAKVRNSPTYSAYCIQPNVRLYLNKAIKKNKIIVTAKGYTWKL